jgi:diguanylate cyclase (GGDEF)-like protein
LPSSTGSRWRNIVGKHLRELAREDVYREIEGHFALALQGYPVSYQRVRQIVNGKPRHLEIKLIPDMGEGGNVLGCFSLTADITEHKLTEQRMQRAAYHDSLTGLPNRLLFGDRLEQTLVAARRDSREFALLYLDLDLFKPVNDRLGHAAGDELLREVAARVRRMVRESDTVARVGGDEFAVILPRIAGREEAQTVAGKIVQVLAIPFEIGIPRQPVQIGASIGIAIYPRDARDAEASSRRPTTPCTGSSRAGLVPPRKRRSRPNCRARNRCVRWRTDGLWAKGHADEDRRRARVRPRFNSCHPIRRGAYMSPVKSMGDVLDRDAAEPPQPPEVIPSGRPGTLLKASALQSAIFNSANFSSIATDAKGVIQIFNVGAERMLGYTAAEVMNKITRPTSPIRRK